MSNMPYWVKSEEDYIQWREEIEYAGLRESPSWEELGADPPWYESPDRRTRREKLHDWLMHCRWRLGRWLAGLWYRNLLNGDQMRHWMDDGKDLPHDEIPF